MDASHEEGVAAVGAGAVHVDLATSVLARQVTQPYIYVNHVAKRVEYM